MRALGLTLLAACRFGFDPIAGDDTPDGGASVRIDVSTTGASGAIRVTTDGAVLVCPATCYVAPGTRVWFEAVAGEAAWFRGWTAGCGGRHECSLVANAPLAVTADFTPEPNLVFLTSSTHGGLLLPTNGDDICTGVANQAGLTGTYKVLLSTANASWEQRVGTARGFIRADGEPVARDITAIDDRILAAYNLDERGNVVTGPLWAPHRAALNAFCNDWTTANANVDGVTIGAIRGSNYHSGGGATPCSGQAHLMCAQVDRNVDLDPVPDVGRQMFTSDGTWIPMSGLAAADTVCKNEAGAAGLSGSFKALLATPGASALSRFSLEAGPWVRPDGIPILPRAAEWMTAAHTDASWHIAANGTKLLYGLIMLGASDPGTPGMDDSTCDGWTANTNSGPPFFTWDTALRLPSGGTNSLCASGARVLCLEE